jgi:hypothetical protein
VLRLQATAGNRATAAALAGSSVQLAPAAGAANTGGVLEVEGFDPIPLQGATWSVKRNMKFGLSGGSRTPEVTPGSSQVGELVLTRQADRQSSSVTRLQETIPIEHGTLRLDRPSRDGALPATSIALDGVAVTSISRSKDEPALETVTLAVGSLSVAGLGKDRPARGTGTTMQITAGGQPWPPMPVLSLVGGRVPPARAGDAGRRSDIGSAAPRVQVKLAAGPALSRVSELMMSGRRVGLVFRRPDGSVEELYDALIERLASSSEGPDVVDVGFIAESISSSSGSSGRAGHP